MTLNDPPKGVFSKFSQFLDATHISTQNCDELLEIDQDNLHVKFSASIQLKSRPSRFKKAGIEDSYPLKVVILPQLSRVA